MCVSSNVRDTFAQYIEAPEKRACMDWKIAHNYPSPHRLEPQNSIIAAWNKKSAVAVDKGFFDALPKLTEVAKEDAEIAWLVYDLKQPEREDAQLELLRKRVVYTLRPSASEIAFMSMNLEPLEKFEHRMQAMLDESVI